MADVGRPPAIDDLVLSKLEEIFALGGTDKEACFYAGISPSTLYKYQEQHPEFTERKEALKETPVLQARRTVVESLKKDVNSAWKFIERKDPELKHKTETDITTKGESINSSNPEALAAAAAAYAEKLKEQKT